MPHVPALVLCCLSNPRGILSAVNVLGGAGTCEYLTTPAGRVGIPVGALALMESRPRDPRAAKAALPGLTILAEAKTIMARAITTRNRGWSLFIVDTVSRALDTMDILRSNYTSSRCLIRMKQAGTLFVRAARSPLN
eukprot:CAMPEP_0113572600 /NCGR_PEP_ID=MMETSP0015_2-20120614/26176_1 /TAXON_ID=2838 /ORGANISM="Odontella" /LENGTH=136 /DNA_ID=CAMNT_0000475633 /DNA_START=345 /DNA_END=755 /DNA_ORIENTATION=+ /assembly_acc=CAM_ASM_000160